VILFDREAKKRAKKRFILKLIKNDWVKAHNMPLTKNQLSKAEVFVWQHIAEKTETIKQLTETYLWHLHQNS
jgi:hypothetical protein